MTTAALGVDEFVASQESSPADLGVPLFLSAAMCGLACLDMKTRDSGMPAPEQWETFFDSTAILRTLGIHRTIGTIVDVGCGYGTFAIAAARVSQQRIIAIAIEEVLVSQLAERCVREGWSQVEARRRDVAAHGIGLADGEANLVLLFNLLHCEQPLQLLSEAHRVLGPGGRVAVIHWRSDIPTPRGPDLSIRPRPEMCHRWLEEAGFEVVIPATTLPPYHFGLVGGKPG